MRIDNIKFDRHEYILLVLTPRFVNGCGRTYVLVDTGAGVITAYGQCPRAALELAGRDGACLTFMECAVRAALAADYGYYIDGGSGVSIDSIDGGFGASAYPAGLCPSDLNDDKRFFSAETAGIASAVAGWPEPVVLFSRNKKDEYEN